jgi:hypothetical protein
MHKQARGERIMPDRGQHKEERPGKPDSGGGHRAGDAEVLSEIDGAPSGAFGQETEESDERSEDGSEERSEEKGDGLSRHWNGRERPSGVKPGSKPDGVMHDKGAGRRTGSAKSRHQKSK